MFYFQAILKFLLLSFSLAFLVSANTFGVDYETPVTLPVCDSQNPKVLFISQDSHWSKINQKDKTIFCVYPGNYSVRPVLKKMARLRNADLSVITRKMREKKSIQQICR